MKSATRTSVAWLNSDQAREHLGFETMKQFYGWLYEAKPRQYRLGNRLRFRQVDLDQCVEAMPEAQPIRLLQGGRR